MTDQITTDYLVIGAGISGLAFADELIASSDASVTIVDERDAPGGHWNDSYPFVRLHQPSSFYGVESTELTHPAIETAGPNRGLPALAGGMEIASYCHTLMRDRLLPSGRVTYLPMTTCSPDGEWRSMLSGRTGKLTVNRKVVDATYYTNVIPLTHVRGFAVDAAARCIPPNDLPRIAPGIAHFTVIGGGKTGMDTCLWLLGHGVEPRRIRWIVPRDQWFVNRAKLQPGAAFFEEVFSGFADARDDIAAATSAIDLALRHEASGIWLRLDRTIMPTMFHAAHVSEGELEELRRIDDVVRLGRVQAISPGGMEMERGYVSAPAETLYIDCSASAVTPRELVPVFQAKRIVLQAIRFPQIPFSAALIAYLEAISDDDAEKNGFASPLPVTTTVEDYVRGLTPDLENRLRAASDPRVRAWIRESRLDGYSRVAARPGATDQGKCEILGRVRQATIAAYANLPALTATLA